MRIASILLGFIFFFSLVSSAQENKENQKPVSVSGKLIESTSKEPVEFASVTVVEEGSENLITGGLSDEQGGFMFEVPGSFSRVKIQVTYLGFQSIENIIDISRGINNMNLGVLVMEADEKMLDEVVISAEQATMNLYVDRKVFNVEKDISTRGGTGEDVMRNIPGLDVDAEGNVSLRNTSATIFIDGRPTTLELQNLPADQIEAVEVITNPSAKFDASSAGGIINIKMKKNRKAGYNGTVSAGIGTTDRYNAMGTLNIRKNPFNLSLNYNLMNAGNNINTFVDRTSLRDGQPNEFFNQTNQSYRSFFNNSIRAVLDYELSSKDLLSFTGNVSFGNWGSDEEQEFSSRSVMNTVNFSGDQFQNSLSSWENYTAQMFYQRRFETKGRELTADINYNRSNRIGDNGISTFNRDGNGVLLPNNPVLQTVESFGYSDQITFQLDYVTPLANGTRFEAGVRSFYQRSDYNNIISRFSYPDDIFFTDSLLSNRFDIVENINAAYVNYVGAWGKLKYQAGVRFEHSFYEGNILDQETSFSYEYPSEDGDFFKALFPSIFLSRKLNDNHELQFNVSRKIGRPRWWQLAPRVDINDPRNIRLGNPELRPEFINLSEINYSFQKGKWSWVSSVYGRLTEDPITWISYPFEGDEEVLITTSVNGTYDYNYGWENIFKFSPGKNLDLTLSVNAYYVRVNSNTPLGDFTNTGYTYDIKPMITYRLPWSMALQINGGYYAPRILPQGVSIPNYVMDVSINKRVGKDWIFNLILSDAFDSRIMGRNFTTPAFIQESTMRRQARFLRFTATYNFGKTDPNWMKKTKRNGQERGGDMDGEF